KKPKKPISGPVSQKVTESRTSTAPVPSTAETMPATTPAHRSGDVLMLNPRGSTRATTSDLGRDKQAPQHLPEPEHALKRQQHEPQSAPSSEAGVPGDSADLTGRSSSSFDELLVKAQTSCGCGPYGAAERLCVQALEQSHGASQA